jgi:WD40 repeat protein
MARGVHDGAGLIVAALALLGSLSGAEPPAGLVRRFGPAQGCPEFAFSPDGRTIALADGAGCVKLWDARSGGFLKTLQEKSIPARALEYSRNGLSIAVGFQNGEIRLFDVAAGRVRQAVPAQNAAVTGLAFSPDGKKLIVRRESSGLSAWDVASGSELWRASSAARELRRPALASGDEGIISDAPSSTAHGKALATFDVTTGATSHEIWLSSDLRLRDLATTPANQHIATADTILCVHLWKKSEIEAVRTFRMPPAPPHREVASVAFSSDGKWLAACASDGLIRVWDMLISEEVLTRTGPGCPNSRIRFAPDGSTLAISVEGEVLLWSLRPEQWPAVPIESAGYYWGDLASAEPPWGYRAVHILVSRPDEAVEVIRKKLLPSPDFPAARLIAQLDDNDYRVRERAYRILAAQGPEMEAMFRSSLFNTSSAEASWRLRNLLANPIYTNESHLLRLNRAVQVLELCGTRGASDLLQELAKDAKGTVIGEQATIALARLNTRR